MIGSGINIDPNNSVGTLDAPGSAIQKICLQGVIAKTIRLEGVIQKC